MRFGREQLTMLGLQNNFYCYTCPHSKVTFQCSLVAWDQLLVFEGTQPSESEHSWRRGQDLVSPAVMDSRLGDTGEWDCWSLVWRGGGGGLVSCVSGTWSRVSGGDNCSWCRLAGLEHLVWRLRSWTWPVPHHWWRLLQDISRAEARACLMLPLSWSHQLSCVYSPGQE